jgi:hypothetical protein
MDDGNLWGLGVDWVYKRAALGGPVKLYLQISAFCDVEL